MSMLYRLQAFVRNKIHYMRLHTKMLLMMQRCLNFARIVAQRWMEVRNDT